MSWHNRYVGVPFVDGGRDMAGLDCWGLVRLIYADQLGITLPSYGEISARDLLGVARAIEGGQEAWRVSELPDAFDVVAMRFYSRSWVGHVGVMVDSKKLIHVEKATAAVVVPLGHPSVRFRIAGFRRHREAA